MHKSSPRHHVYLFGRPCAADSFSEIEGGQQGQCVIQELGVDETIVDFGRFHF